MKNEGRGKDFIFSLFFFSNSISNFAWKSCMHCPCDPPFFLNFLFSFYLFYYYFKMHVNSTQLTLTLTFTKGYWEWAWLRQSWNVAWTTPLEMSQHSHYEYTIGTLILCHLCPQFLLIGVEKVLSLISKWLCVWQWVICHWCQSEC